MAPHSLLGYSKFSQADPEGHTISHSREGTQTQRRCEEINHSDGWGERKEAVQAGREGLSEKAAFELKQVQDAYTERGKHICVI